jgi:hypothetical protein
VINEDHNTIESFSYAIEWPKIFSYRIFSNVSPGLKLEKIRYLKANHYYHQNLTYTIAQYTPEVTKEKFQQKQLVLWCWKTSRERVLRNPSPFDKINWQRFFVFVKQSRAFNCTFTGLCKKVPDFIVGCWKLLEIRKIRT